MANGFYNFPHGRTYDSDLGFLIKLYKDVIELLNTYLENAVIKFADPIMWDITEQYTALTCVVDKDGTAYISKQPVPAGIDIRNTNYWLPIFNYDDNINKLRSQIAYNDRNSTTATKDLEKDELVFLDGVLYKALVAIPHDTIYREDENIEHVTINDMLGGFNVDLAAEIAARIAGDQANAAALEAETAARIAGDQANAAALEAETAARIAGDQANASAIATEKTAREDADTVINDRISAIEGAISGDFSQLMQMITNEIQNRINGDEALTQAIAAETSAREADVYNLGQRLEAEAAARAAEDVRINERIDNIQPGGETFYHMLSGTTAAEINAELIANAGTPIVFKNQIYNLTEPLVIPANSRINLNGAELRRTGSIHNIINITGDNVTLMNGSVNGLVWEDGLTNNNWQHRFSNIYITGDNCYLYKIKSTGNCSAETQSEGVNSPIVLDNCKNTYIVQCSSIKDGGSGVFLVEAEGVYIDKFYSYQNAGSGISGHGYDVVISNSTVIESGTVYPNYYASAYTGFGLNGQRFLVSNCISRGNSGSGYICDHNTTGTDFYLVNCIAENCTLDGFTIGAYYASLVNCAERGNTRSGLRHIVSGSHVHCTGCDFKSGGIAILNGDAAFFVNCMFDGCSLNCVGIVMLSHCYFRNITHNLGMVIVTTPGHLIGDFNTFIKGETTTPRAYFVTGVLKSIYDRPYDCPLVATSGGGVEAHVDLP